MSQNSFGTASTLTVAGADYRYYRLATLSEKGIADISKLPFSHRILLENLLRCEDGRRVRANDIETVASGSAGVAGAEPKEISFMPARVLLQDFTGVPCVVDIAAMRDALQSMGADPLKANPLMPADLVIDHSVQVDEYGTKTAFDVNALLEFQRNRERYMLLRWGQTAFRNFRVVPPDTGIVHQVNLEYLAEVVFRIAGRRWNLDRLSRLAGRHRFPHHDDQWTGRGRLGRRRNRSRSLHARSAGFDAAASLSSASSFSGNCPKAAPRPIWF